MKTLLLPLKKKWFDQTKSGEKKFDYRLYNLYWEKRLVGKKFDRIVLTLGYPKANDSTRRIEREYKGFHVDWVTHEEWSDEPKLCFCILVN